MLFRWTDPKTGVVTDLPAIKPHELTGRTRDLAALQRETRWKLAEITDLAQLEGPALAIALFLSFRATGRLITYARAEELLDEVEPIVEPGDEPDEAEEEVEDPTSAPTASDRGDEPPAAAAASTGSPRSRSSRGSRSPSAGA